VAATKPLTLRRQRASSVSKSASLPTSNLQAEVLVDTGVYHLSEPYSYHVPVDLLGQVVVGSVVNVPFASSTKIGVVLKLGPNTSAGLKSISSMNHNIPIQKTLLDLADHISSTSVCTPFDAYRFVLPLAKKGHITAPSSSSASTIRGSSMRTFVQASIGEDLFGLLTERIARNPKTRRLLLFPTIREVRRFLELCEASHLQIVEYGSTLPISARKQAFVDVASGAARIAVGTRSAIFAPFPSLDEIIVVDEWSEHYREQRSPYWNLRDLALARARVEKCDLFFLSSTPSLELFHLIERGEISHVRKSRLSSIRPRSGVTCSPRPYIDVMRRALKNGPVLVTVAERNFSNLFICQKCRSVARCKCGGKIIMAKRGVFVCSLCSNSTNYWRCVECDGTQYVMMRSGIEKVMEEISKSLPNIPVFMSTQEKEISYVNSDTAVIISTSGMEPTSPKGFAAAVLLDGEELSSRPFIRAEEDLLQRWMKTLQRLAIGGEIYLSLPSTHKISQAIISNNPTRYLADELSDRRKIGLPPTRIVIRIESKEENLSALRSRLSQQFPNSSIHLSGDSRTVTILQPSNENVECLASLRALQKVRSVQSKEIFRISINPYHF